MTVKTTAGLVSGIKEGRWTAFRGIPFGKAPVGELRFMPPQPADKWDGVFEAVKDGIRPWQKIAPWVTDGNTHEYGEDCLNLNVWAPDTEKKNLPVLVYFFGGGHFEGSNCEKGIDAQGIFRDEDFILVAPNYRVGALGYLYLAHLLGPEYAASGSLGTLDQVLALKWVKDNISAFGGDPSNVTIMGQSAGAKSVSCLTVCPQAKGLFNRAIMMSGGLQCIKDTETEKALTANFMKAAGISDAHELLTMSVEDIRTAQEEANKTYFKAESYGPTADGVVFPEDFAKHISELDLHGISILMGGTAQELFINPLNPGTPMTDEEMQARMDWKFGGNAGRVMEVFLKRKAENGYLAAYNDTVTEYTYVQGLMRTAKAFAAAGADVHMYRWDYHNEGELARHTSDLETLFGVIHPDNADAGNSLRRIWLGFISGKEDACFWPAVEGDYLPRLAISDNDRLFTHAVSEIDMDFPLQVMKLHC